MEIWMILFDCCTESVRHIYPGFRNIMTSMQLEHAGQAPKLCVLGLEGRPCAGWRLA